YRLTMREAAHPHVACCSWGVVLHQVRGPREAAVSCRSKSASWPGTVSKSWLGQTNFPHQDVDCLRVSCNISVNRVLSANSPTRPQRKRHLSREGAWGRGARSAPPASTRFWQRALREDGLPAISHDVTRGTWAGFDSNRGAPEAEWPRPLPLG